METDLKDGMCRCCASEGSYKDFTASYQWMGVEEVYADMLKDCFDVTLSTSSTVSNGGICEVCITQLRNAFNFKKQVLNTEEQFKKLQENIVKADIVKVELPHDDMETSDVGGNMDDDFSGPEYDIPIKSIKIEKAEEAKTKKRTARASTSKAKKPKADVGESSAKREPGAIDRIAPSPTGLQGSVDRSLVFSKTRSNIKEILEYSNATPIKCKASTGYACSFCDKLYPDPTDLKKHTLSEHYKTFGFMTKNMLKEVVGETLELLCVKLDITGLTCKLCKCQIKDLKGLFQHLHRDHNRLIHEDIKNHIVPFKFDTEKLSCCVCSKEFGSFKSLLGHMNTHSTNYTCEVCFATFINSSRLSMHKKIHETGQYQCSFCPEVLDTKIKKVRHERRRHTFFNQRAKCGYCVEGFKNKEERDTHCFKVHGVPLPKNNKYECSICFKKYSRRYLLTHVRCVHLKEKRFACEFCDKKFYELKALKKHIHTGEKNYHCDHCKKAFGVKNALRDHMKVHKRIIV